MSKSAERFHMLWFAATGFGQDIAGSSVVGFSRSMPENPSTLAAANKASRLPETATPGPVLVQAIDH